MKTYFLQVKEIIQETSDAISIQFWHPISEQIKYKAGQFITISIPDTNGKKIKRSYSMSSSPHTDSSVAVTIKRVKGGVVSNYLNDKVSKGDFLEILEPMGNFYFEPQAVSKRNIVLIGAGSGITPLMSIAKSVLKTEENTKVLLVYGNRNEDTIIFKKELSELENAYRDRLNVVHVLSQSASNWVGNKGRINQANLIIFLKNWGVNFLNDHFYMCGPVEMMEECKKMFSLFEVPDSNIYSEKFNSPAVFEELSQNTANELVQRLVTINYDNNTYELKVEAHQSILEAALEQDIDLPYSCQAGMCTACMGKCVSGKILMDEEDGLTEKEIKEGYVLTCVAHPLTDGVVLEIE